MEYFFENISKLKTKDSSRFTLSHYGLPEPDFDGSRRVRPLRYVFIIMGLLLISIALWKMYRKRQEK
jgi:hypothetical protein